MRELRENTRKDPELMILKEVILEGWPASKHNCVPDIVEYWNIREELTVAEDIIFKGSKVVIPKGMRKGMLKKIHECHLGIDKYRKRGKEVLYWPRINRDIEQMVKSCSSCIKYGNKLGHEALKPHELPLRAWQRGASDIFQYKSMDYLVITDYYSNFPEVLKIKNSKL